jgi:hypothetical protein
VRTARAVCRAGCRYVSVTLGGLPALAVGTDGNGLHVVTVWRSKAHQERWQAEQLIPVFQALGMADVPTNTGMIEYDADEFYVR